MSRSPLKIQGRRALWLENILLAFEAMRDRKFRTFLTITGVFIGVVIIVGVASVLNGFRQRVVDNLEQFGANNLYITREPMVEVGRPSSEIRRRRQLTLQDALAVAERCPSLVAVSPSIDAPPEDVVVRYRGEELVGPSLSGVFPSMSQVMNAEITSGRFFTEEENRAHAAVCVIGAAVVEGLFPNQTPVDRDIQVAGRTFRVLGVMAKFKDSPFGGENPQDSTILIPYTIFRDMFPWRREPMISARAKSGQLQRAIAEVEDIMRIRRKVAWNAPNDFEIGTSDSMIRTFDKIVFATMAVMFALSTVAFMVGGVGVMNVMLASVRERTREIGVRRAIGARRSDIIGQFLTEAMTLTGAGGLLGVGIGEALMLGIAAIFPTLPCATPMWARVFGFMGSVGVGLVFGLWPAVAAARVDPITALRYE